jgi:5-methylcytosine-specific restriction endonuclease McrA
VLVFLKKAELTTETNNEVIRTVSRSYPLPAVIRLFRYIHLPYKSVVLTRQNVFKRDRHTCQYCGTLKNLTLDHVHPRSKGGKSSWSNLVTACQRCNAHKGDRTPEEAGMPLRCKPFKPNYLMFLSDFSGNVREEWKPFLRHEVKV